MNDVPGQYCPSYGGGMFLSQSIASVSGSTFSGNTAVGGAAIYAESLMTRVP